MVIGLLQNVTVHHNAFPHTNDISDLSPLTIFKGKIIDFALHCQVEFGVYAQTKNQTENNMHARMTRAIAMDPSLNYQGGTGLRLK